jgi:hypothetical protein
MQWVKYTVTVFIGTARYLDGRTWGGRLTLGVGGGGGGVGIW